MREKLLMLSGAIMMLVVLALGVNDYREDIRHNKEIAALEQEAETRVCSLVVQAWNTTWDGARAHEERVAELVDLLGPTAERELANCSGYIIPILTRSQP